MHKISQRKIRHTNRKRGLIAGAVVFFIFMSFSLWKSSAISISAFADALMLAFIVAVGHVHYPWAADLVEASQWTLEPETNSLIFHYRGGIARIEGADINKIRAKFNHGEISWFDIYYRNQVTRIKNYNAMDKLYLHAKNISAESIELEELR